MKTLIFCFFITGLVCIIWFSSLKLNWVLCRIIGCSVLACLPDNIWKFLATTENSWRSRGWRMDPAVPLLRQVPRKPVRPSQWRLHHPDLRWCGFHRRFPVRGSRGVGRPRRDGHERAARLPAGRLVRHPRLHHHHVLRGPGHHLQWREDSGTVWQSGNWRQACDSSASHENYEKSINPQFRLELKLQRIILLLCHCQRQKL